MASENTHCDDCNMTFKTFLQLQKHKEKFCIGASVGDPTTLAPSGPPGQIPRIQINSRAQESPVHGARVSSFSQIRKCFANRLIENENTSWKVTPLKVLPCKSSKFLEFVD